MNKVTKFRSVVLTMLAAGMIGSVLAIIPTTKALAAFDCSSWQSTIAKAHARCNLGLGGVRVWADCRSLLTGIPFPRKYGPTVPVGSISTVTCYSGTIVVNHGYQIQ
jgi:hypothetical protein